ncbi:MAG: hypothetical protein LBC49_04155 [Bacteroidales bacterium]|jgi:hypothetical protein|nr:hypothetical protein [Bacteroidales bacterium]
MNTTNLIYALYSDNRTVFRLKDVAMLTKETDFVSLNQRLHYFVRTGKLQNPRKGIYCKQNYNLSELACRIYIPAYISLEFVLQRAGVVFQYDSSFTMVSYLSREIDIEENTFSFRKIKNEILLSPQGIERKENGINIATAERAFLDIIYLNGKMYFDYLHSLDKEKIEQILPIYQSKTMNENVAKILKDV